MDVTRATILIGLLQVLLIGITVGQPQGFGRPWQSRGSARSFRSSRPTGFQSFPPGPEYRTLGAQGLTNNFPGQLFSGVNLDTQRLPIIRTINRGTNSRTQTWPAGPQRQQGTILHTRRGSAGTQHRPIVIRHSSGSQRTRTSSQSQIPVIRSSQARVSSSGSRTRTQLTQQPVRSSQTVRRPAIVTPGKPSVPVPETRHITKQAPSLVSLPKDTHVPMTQPDKHVGKISLQSQATLQGQTVLQTSIPDAVQLPSESNPASVKTTVVHKEAPPLHKFEMPSKDVMPTNQHVAQSGTVLSGPKLETVQASSQKNQETKGLHMKPQIPRQDTIIQAPKQVHKVAPLEDKTLHMQPIAPSIGLVSSGQTHKAPKTSKSVHTSHTASSQLHKSPVVSSSHAERVGSGLLQTAPLVSNSVSSGMSSSHQQSAHVPTAIHSHPAATSVGHAQTGVHLQTGQAQTGVHLQTGHAQHGMYPQTGHAQTGSHFQTINAQHGAHLQTGHAQIGRDQTADATQSVQDELVAAFVAALQEQLALKSAAQPVAPAPAVPAQPAVYQQAHAQMYNPYAAYYQPMMAAHLYPAYMQEMLFGDTQDPPDPTEAVPNTTTAAPEPSTVATPDPTTLAQPDPTTPTEIPFTVIVTDVEPTDAATTFEPITTDAQSFSTAPPQSGSQTTTPSQTFTEIPLPGEWKNTKKKKQQKLLIVEPLNKETIAKLAAVSNAVKSLKGNIQPETRAKLVQGIRKIVSNSKVDFASLQSALTKQLSDLKAKAPANEVTAAHHMTNPPSPLAQTTLPPKKLKTSSAVDAIVTVKTDESPPAKVVPDKSPINVQSLVDGGQTTNTATLEAMLKEIVSQSNGSKILPHELKNVNFTEIARSLTPNGTDLAAQLSDPNFVKVLREIAAKIHLMARAPNVTSAEKTKTKENVVT